MKNVRQKAFCLAPNERELSKLLTQSILFEGSFARSKAKTIAKENENHVSLEYVKKSKTDFDFLPDDILQ